MPKAAGFTTMVIVPSAPNSCGDTIHAHKIVHVMHKKMCKSGLSTVRLLLNFSGKIHGAPTFKFIIC